MCQHRSKRTSGLISQRRSRRLLDHCRHSTDFVCWKLGHHPDPANPVHPATPTGSLGSATNPFGSPATPATQCASTGSPTAALALTVANQGFSQACYAVPAQQAVPASLTNGVVNTSTGLTITLEVTISTIANPVVGQQIPPPGAATADTSQRTLPQSSLPNVELQNAVYTSPSATDGNPLSFTIPPLSAGSYLLQLPTYPTVPSAVLTVGGAGAASSGPEPVTTTTTVDTSGVSTVAATTASEEELDVALRAGRISPHRARQTSSQARIGTHRCPAPAWNGRWQALRRQATVQ